MNLNMLLAFGATEITLCVIAGVILIGLIVFLCLVPFRLYTLALTSGAYIPAVKLISMKKRKLDVKLLVETYIASKKAGLNLTIKQYEAHLIAGGDISKLLKAILLAKQSRLNVDISTLMAIDKAGEDVVNIVDDAIQPDVIPFSNVVGMSRDNIELIVGGKLTVRANLKKFLGGVPTQTLLARISSEIVNTINNSEYYNVVLENPKIVSDILKSKKFDSDGAYDILSVDITNVKIGENYNLRHIREAAEKKKVEIEIETERLKQKSILEEQQTKVKVQHAKIELINQEKEFAKSLYEAVKNKDFDALEYFKLKNLQADTEMRNVIAHPNGNKDVDLDSLFDDDLE